MFKLYNLFEQVILESIHRDKVLDAITKKHRVNITYDDGTGTHTGKRTIEVYVYGRLKNSKPAIRAYQVFGDTKSSVRKDKNGKVIKEPKWKTFLVDNILTWEATNFHFYTPISDRDPSLKDGLKAYREDGGDDLFSTIYATAEFNHDKYDSSTANTGVFQDIGVDTADKSDLGKVKYGGQDYDYEESEEEYEDDAFTYNDYQGDKTDGGYEEEPAPEDNYQEEPNPVDYEEEDVIDDEEEDSDEFNNMRK